MYRLRTQSTVLSVALLASVATHSEAKEPPPAGPPWVRDLPAAQKSALEKGVPIFIYFTKKV
jgi:hypothetical protein